MKVAADRWYILIHQLPPKPLYLRAKIRQRLRRAGAIALKNSVYALPRTREALRALESIAEAAMAGGGEAFICDARFADPRMQDRALKRLRAAPGPSLVGRTWVTRKGIQIDRIASAWLVRRFVDPDARFRFIDPGREKPRSGELRFDMADGDFTHEEDRCTFETLLVRLDLRDAALAAVAEIVHDIDLKDGKFSRPEAPGVEQLIVGIILGSALDKARLERGLSFFDDLYQSFQRQRETHPKQSTKKGGKP